jgi:ABC-type glycerol-3-phosphate transport system substrate-binding protein
VSNGFALDRTNFQVSEDALYFLEDALYRIPLDEELDFGKKEEIASFSELAAEEDILCFAVDGEENLYYCSSPYFESPRITLHKRSADGEVIYRIRMEEENPETSITSGQLLAVDPDGNAYLLANDAIWRYDENGELTGTLTLDAELGGSFLIRKSLLKLPGGEILFVVNNGVSGSREVYTIQKGNTPKLTEVEALSEDLSMSVLYEGLNGLLIGETDGWLYQYHMEDGSREALLRWEDSDIYKSSVQALMQLTEEQFLVVTIENSPDTERSWQMLTLLVKTPAEEVPQKEQITLASLSPTGDLQEAVVKFNRSSDLYHVTIESYGATMENRDGAFTRLDSSLTSKEQAPDLLDLSFLDITKYADAGALEDLNTYMKADETIKREDFLGNLLEGYTLNGKLVCIPKAFTFMGAFVTDERALEAEEWTVKSLMATAETYDVSLFSGDWDEPDVILQLFFSDYIMEKFIDWERGTCDLESQEFCSLLEWIKEQTLPQNTSRESLLNPRFINGFENYHHIVADSEEVSILRGLPTLNGRMDFIVSVDNALGIVSNSGHKEGAWAFLQYFLQTENAYKYSSYTYRFPTRLTLLEQIAEDITTPNYLIIDEKIIKDSDGNPIINPESAYYRDGILHEYYAMEQQDADALMDLLKQIDFTPDSELKQSIISILSEESEAFFNGGKTAQDAAAIIQNRVQLLISE